jgi:hypothetical protein
VQAEALVDNLLVVFFWIKLAFSDYIFPSQIIVLKRAETTQYKAGLGLQIFTVKLISSLHFSLCSPMDS